MTVRVRFAPSPTGHFHIGSARTALYNFLFARHHQGTFLLRIEDTDRVRSTQESLQTILDGMKWLGLSYDEKPYFQSQRRDLHRSAAKKLEKEGKAYWKEDLEKGKALYFPIPRDQKIEFDDLILGKISVDPSTDDAYQRDLVILKSDGSPTYNFAVVVDDADMNISHVIRGQDHISNTPKQVLLYQAMGITPPKFAHIPLILDEKGKKFSKRMAHSSLEENVTLGYLPGPFVNFLALLGWAPGDDREIMTLSEMVHDFSLERVNKSSAKFLPEKLNHMNGVEIRKQSLDQLVELCLPYLQKAYDLSSFSQETIHAAVHQQHERIKTLSEIIGLTRFVFAEKIEFDAQAVEKVLKKNDAFNVLDHVKTALSSLIEFSTEEIEKVLKKICEEQNLKFKHVAQPIRVALTGTMMSPSIHETVAIVGRKRVLARLDAALQLRNLE